jgi:homocysteine S-methyltransferase
MYPATPEYFGEYALAFVEAGARLVGGCCGTTAAHIEQMRSALDDPARQPTILTGLPGGYADPTAFAPALETTRLARRLKEGDLVVTVEISPPKGYSVEKTLAAVELLKTAGANMINVADSPRARMRMSPWALCHLIQDRVGLETLLHFPTRGRNILRIQGDLLAAHALNVRNIFAVMGDPTTIGDYPDALNDYDVVPTGLITLLKQKFNQGIDHGGESLAQPTNFVVGCAVNLTPDDPGRELNVLRRKIESGADFALTQPVYDVSRAREFIAMYETRYGPWALPIIAGVLPLYSARHAEFLHNEVPGIDISADLQSRMRLASDQAAQEGVKIALEIIDQFRQFVQGIYMIPAFGRYDLVAEIIEQLS